MSTLLRSAAALFLSMSMTGAAWAGPAIDAALDSADWDESAPVAIDDVALMNPLSTDVIQLASATEPCKCATDLGCGECLGCADGVDLCGCGPTWYASAGMIFMKRDRPQAGAVVAANPAGTPFSSASDFSFDWEPGVDVALRGASPVEPSLRPAILGSIPPTPTNLSRRATLSAPASPARAVRISTASISRCSTAPRSTCGAR